MRLSFIINIYRRLGTADNPIRIELGQWLLTEWAPLHYWHRSGGAERVTLKLSWDHILSAGRSYPVVSSDSEGARGLWWAHREGEVEGQVIIYISMLGLGLLDTNHLARHLLHVSALCLGPPILKHNTTIINYPLSYNRSYWCSIYQIAIIVYY